MNGVFAAAKPGDAVADAMTQRGIAALAAMPANLAELPGSKTRFVPRGTVGLDALRELIAPMPARQLENRVASAADAIQLPPNLVGFVDEIAATGRGVIMTMGKGGVGKTTVASAIALALAQRGHAVHLSTTDPAAHVAEALGETIAGLKVSRIDPANEVARYTEEVLTRAAPQLDEAGRALLEEDLRSPCTEEIGSSAHLPRPLMPAEKALLSSTRHPQGIRCCCWMPPKPIIARYCAHREICLEV